VPGDSYSLLEIEGSWKLCADGQPTRTPMGLVVQTRHLALAERLLETARRGDQPDDLTPHRLQLRYLDFGLRVPLKHLESLVVAALDPRWDVACKPPEDPDLAEALRRGYQLTGADGDIAQLRAHVKRLSRRALTTIAVFSARFQSARLGLKAIDPETDVERLAVGTCRLVAERRVGPTLEGDPRFLVPPVGEREGYCRDHCLPTIAGDPAHDAPVRAPRDARSCWTRRLLEGARFFASFADE
jgi:hypothetical protein